MADVRLDFDVNAETARLMVEYAFLAEEGAEYLRDEVHASLRDAPGPAPSGSPPHSHAGYRESWKASRARTSGLSVVAWAYSLAKAANGEPLPPILERGDGPINPHPHYRPAEPRAQRKLDALVARENARR